MPEEKKKGQHPAGPASGVKRLRPPFSKWKERAEELLCEGKYGKALDVAIASGRIWRFGRFVVRKANEPLSYGNLPELDRFAEAFGLANNPDFLRNRKERSEEFERDVLRLCGASPPSTFSGSENSDCCGAANPAIDRRMDPAYESKRRELVSSLLSQIRSELATRSLRNAELRRTCSGIRNTGSPGELDQDRLVSRMEDTFNSLTERLGRGGLDRQRILNARVKLVYNIQTSAIRHNYKMRHEEGGNGRVCMSYQKTWSSWDENVVLSQFYDAHLDYGCGAESVL
jgi:hypothetical protein